MKLKFLEDIQLHMPDRISKADALRQEQTAREILERLNKQPGVILADEVGMGKTYVALAVAVSAYLSDPERRPSVVMVPSGLKEKWPREFETFVSGCLPKEMGNKLRSKRADRGEDFLRLLDDAPDRRASVIFLTHGAMAKGLNDSWIKLALIQQALKGRHEADDIKRALGRFAGELLHLKWAERDHADLWEQLFKRQPSEWGNYLRRIKLNPTRSSAADDIDDPIPEVLIELFAKLNTDAVYKALQLMPRRESTHLSQRLTELRQEINSLMKDLWAEVMKGLKLRLPLLILDEAHHLKNAHTRTASLFHSPESADDANEVSGGALASVFSRMLFLTATPFQLGHNELISVLERFEGIDWASLPSMTRPTYKETLGNLRSVLDASQVSALRLDKVWGELNQSDLFIGETAVESVDDWWTKARSTDLKLTPKGELAVSAFNETKTKMRLAEEQLRPWVIRHSKPTRYQEGKINVRRRETLEGDAINTGKSSSGQSGLKVAEESLLPFLLAARAVSCSPESRPVFAEGLASSYEAFLNTRARRIAEAIAKKESLAKSSNVAGAVVAPGAEVTGGIDDDESEAVSENEATSTEDPLMNWYLDQIQAALPKANGIVSTKHPKLQATVDRTLTLWERGEKVLVFCHYIETGKALRLAISEEVAKRIETRAASRTGLSVDQAMKLLDNIGDRFKSDANRAVISAKVNAEIAKFPELKEYEAGLTDVVTRMLRTPTFLVRYFPIDRESENTADLLQIAFEVEDGSGVTFSRLIHQFFRFLAKRCEPVERGNYIDAVLKVQTGSHSGSDAASSFAEDEQAGAGERLVANVRLANGATKNETRQRLMLTFNTPFYPEILIASSVMAEGVDLHLNCRHVIHHDLSWNPSSLEQRTGRVDRIGAKIETSGKSIQVYLPFVAETQDEKMYRVVMDRERWFKVVMGEKYKIDARSTEATAIRLALPLAAAEELQFKLSVADQFSAQEKAG